MTLTLSGWFSGLVSEGNGRTLVVMRHAKAEQDGPTDFERPLADRGHGDAAAAGRWLAEQGVVPDLALVSAALRTRETYAAVAAAAGWELEPTLDRGLYAADPDTVLDIVRAGAGEARTLLLIGHNPTTASLVQLLDDGSGDDDAVTATSGDFPTSALAVFSYDGDWSDLGFGSAGLTAYHVGRA